MGIDGKLLDTKPLNNMANANQVDDKPRAWYPHEVADSPDSIKINEEAKKQRIPVKTK